MLKFKKEPEAPSLVIRIAEYRYIIEKRPEIKNVGADTLSKIAHVNTRKKLLLFSLYEKLAHLGKTNFWHFINYKNLPYTLEDFKQTITTCKTCRQ